MIAAAGGLMSYGPNPPNQQRRTAYFVDKILKGAKAAELPTTFDLGINLKAARAIGLAIPQAILQQATQLIE